MINNIVKSIMHLWEESDSCIESVTPSIPKTLMLELTNACNLSCIMCFNSKMKRKKGLMSLGLVEKILDEAKEIGIKNIALYTTGESLLHKRFVDVVKLCKKRNLYCYLTSNGLLLNREICYQICENGLDSFKFSIDGATREEYEKIRIGASFKDLMNKIKMLKSVRDEIHSPMSIYASSVLMKFTEKKVEQFKATFGPYLDSILLSSLTNQGGHMLSEYENLRGNLQDGIRSKWKPCGQLWERMVISYDGRLTACCVDYDLKMVYGDFSKVSLKEAWHSSRIIKWRENHLKSDVNDMPLCKICNSPYIQQVEVLSKINKY